MAQDATLSDHNALADSALRFADRVRSPGDLERLAKHEQRIYLPLVLSAVLPIVVAISNATTDSRVSVVVNVVAWLVFVFDLLVHIRLVRGYLKMGVGIFDLVVVIITAPWFLLPGAGNSQVLVVARLARLVRLLFISKGARQAGRRLGSVGLFAGGMLLFCSWMAYVAEHPTNPEFANFGDSIWWGLVTLTTVGYGDIVPETRKGRFAASFLMATGVATLGLISGTLASAFRRVPSGDGDGPSPPAATAGAPPTAPAAWPAELTAELAAMRAQLASIEQQLAALSADPRPDEPTQRT